jgi:hypothetical protein
MEKIIDSDESFRHYLEKEVDISPDGATLNLIGQAYEQDGDAWGDYELLEFIEELCLMYRAYSNRKVKA